MMTMRFSSILAIGLVAALLGLNGCSDFDRDWNAAAAAKPADQTDITGRWEGTWSSDANGHCGGLRCIITRLDPRSYHARYAATYAGIFHFGYEMTLIADKQNDWVQFEGSADLGSMAGGNYHYEGHANAEAFYATYKSSDDHGRFN